MIYYILLTAITVSIDSLVCGFSLSFSTKKKTPIILGISVTVFIMCLITNYLPVIFVDTINENTACLGGIILIGVGLYNLLKKDEKKEREKNNHNTLKQALVTGVAVGFDGATANLSLSLMGLNALYVPIIIAVCHGIMIWVGILLSKTPPAKKFAKIEFLPPIILILLGGYKLLGLFI